MVAKTKGCSGGPSELFVAIATTVEVEKLWKRGDPSLQKLQINWTDQRADHKYIYNIYKKNCVVYNQVQHRFCPDRKNLIQQICRLNSYFSLLNTLPISFTVGNEYIIVINKKKLVTIISYDLKKSDLVRILNHIFFNIRNILCH